MAATRTHRRELAHRESAGIAVSLFWSLNGKTITVEVLDLRTGEFFALDVARAGARRLPPPVRVPGRGRARRG
jgi:hypothetical protein